jgi:predicted O-methyltransferase YrrM
MILKMAKLEAAESVLQKSIRILRTEGPGTFAKKGWRALQHQCRPLQVIFYPYAKWRIPQLTDKSYSAETAVNIAMHGFGRYISPTQVRSEILSLATIVERLKPRTVLEIGTSKGGTLFLWARLATADAHIISIDLPGGENEWAYPRWKEPFYKTFASKKQKIDLVRGDSHSARVFDEFRKALGDEKIDLLFIDGDHSYEGVKKDYQLYSPFVRTGGIVAFHDIAVHPAITGSEVHLFWDELSQGKDAKEFIENKDQGWAGIGVVSV